LHAPYIPSVGPDGRNIAGHSDNWSGFVITDVQYTKLPILAEAGWTVPTVTYATYPSISGPEGSSTWVGIGGWNNDVTGSDPTLIQAGTEQDVASSSSPATYYAWYELLPAAQIRLGIFNSNLPNNNQCAASGPLASCPVQPGDSVGVLINCLNVGGNTCTSPGTMNEWEIEIQNSTQGWFYSVIVNYASSQATVEWIHEATSSCSTLPPCIEPLPAYTPVTFTYAEVGSPTGGTAPILNLSIASNGVILSDPFGGWSKPCSATNFDTYYADLFIRYGTACSSIVDSHDFNADGFGDILWHDISGDVAIWLMNGTSILNPTASYVATVSPSTWSIVGQRDFNGDGYADLLWRDTAGDVAIWLMNGTTILNPTTSYVATVSPAWSIVGTGDFNGDGKSDILWRDTAGDVAIWLMNGTTILNPTTSYVGTVSPSTWTIVGTGDFNGDGYTDILWRDTAGDVAIWEMNGTTILNPTATYVATVSTAWSIVGTGDFNGDGMSDILWQDTSGDVAIWEMNGTTILNPTTSYVATVSPSIWSIVETGDFNGDGYSDILWRDTSGDVTIWLMNGTTLLNPTATYVDTVPIAWSIQGAGAD